MSLQRAGDMHAVEPGATVFVDETYANGDAYRGEAIVVLRPASDAGGYDDGRNDDEPALSHTRRVVYKHGRGEYRFSNGASYDGEWAMGQMHGKGVFQEVLAGAAPAAEATVDPATGQLTVNATPVGDGDAVARTAVPGDRYEGQWAHGQRTHGIYRFVGGDMYVGGFQDNLKHGPGVVWESMTAYSVVYDGDVLLRKVPMAAALNNEAAVVASLSPPSARGDASPYALQQRQQPAYDDETDAPRVRAARRAPRFHQEPYPDGPRDGRPPLEVAQVHGPQHVVSARADRRRQAPAEQPRPRTAAAPQPTGRRGVPGEVGANGTMLHASQADVYHRCHRRCQGPHDAVCDADVEAALDELHRRKVELWDRQPLARRRPDPRDASTFQRQAPARRPPPPPKREPGVWAPPTEKLDPQDPRSERHDFLLDRSGQLRHQFRYHLH